MLLNNLFLCGSDKVGQRTLINRTITDPMAGKLISPDSSRNETEVCVCIRVCARARMGASVNCLQKNRLVLCHCARMVQYVF